MKMCTVAETVEKVSFPFLTKLIKKILKHLRLWYIKRKPCPVANAPPIIPDSYPIPSVDDYVIDPDYPIETYL